MKYKASQRDINMPVDKNLQRRIIKYFVWGTGIFTFLFIMLLNFIM